MLANYKTKSVNWGDLQTEKLMAEKQVGSWGNPKASTLCMLKGCMPKGWHQGWTIKWGQPVDKPEV